MNEIDFARDREEYGLIQIGITLNPDVDLSKDQVTLPISSDSLLHTMNKKHVWTNSRNLIPRLESESSMKWKNYDFHPKHTPSLLIQRQHCELWLPL